RTWWNRQVVDTRRIAPVRPPSAYYRKAPARPPSARTGGHQHHTAATASSKWETRFARQPTASANTPLCLSARPPKRLPKLWRGSIRS
ncbi:MAG TPA: hypothetical protein PKM04_05915, partial [Accumulibacter sp.]|nr:hypothetical protein [Accumulibacter sp.]